MEQYKILNIIGQGAFGNAYLAHHIAQDQNYVIKKIELTNKTQQQTENIFNQVKLLQQFKHVNIVSYRQSIIEGQQLNIIMEFCYGGDLNQLITEQKQNQAGRKLQQPKIVDWATQIALAIFYMHDKRILHRDLKTPNIFISDDKVKLGDFGISKVLDQKIDLASTSIGTPYYMSPEQYRHKPYSYKSDMWAFGCILYQMCNQKRPFEAYSLNGLAVKVLEANFAPVSEYYSKELRELIKRMLQKKQKDRPLINQFLQTPIIKKRAITYIREMYQKLSQQNGDKDLLEGVMYQAKKLGISLFADKKEGDISQRKSKPEFSAQKKRQQKERIRQQLQEQLRKLSQKDKEQKEQLRKLTEDRKNLLKKSKKQVDRSQITNRKSHSSSTKSLKQQPTSASQSKRSTVPSVKGGQEKQKPFQIKQKYDMYEMEFEEEDSQEEHPVEAIDQVDEDDQKGDKQHKHQHKQYDKERYTKISQTKESSINKSDSRAEYKAENKPQIKIQTKQQGRVQPKIQTRPQVKYQSRVQPKPEKIQAKPQRVQIKQQAKVQPSKPPQIAVSQSKSKFQAPFPIEQAIVNLKQSLKLNKQALYTVKNQLSNIDFQISSSDDELNKTVEHPQQLPKMKKKQKNPVHVVLSDKANDLRQSLQSALLNNGTVQKLIKLAQARSGQATRTQIQKISEGKPGAYHLAFQFVKITTLLQKIPFYI